MIQYVSMISPEIAKVSESKQEALDALQSAKESLKVPALDRAIENLKFIDQLRQTPSVNVRLAATRTAVEIVFPDCLVDADGLFGMDRLHSTTYQLDEDVLRRDELSVSGRIRLSVMAKLDKVKIVEKFERAIKSSRDRK